MTGILELRVERPYPTETEFLQSESWTITKRSVFLVGVTAHPEGAIARCELVLSTGSRLLVAEGVVARYVPKTAERPAGLVVRYRRLTPASTQFVNRALAARRSAEESSPSASVQQSVAGMPEDRETAPARSTEGQACPPIRKREVPEAAIQMQSNTQVSLRRLSGRAKNDRIVAPLNRATLLSRLRARAATNINR
jgi:hypothetical protein